MREEIERRLHRVRIKQPKKKIICPKSGVCNYSESCPRCNRFYRKCFKFTTPN